MSRPYPIERVVISMPARRGIRDRAAISGMIRPKTWVFPPARIRADELGMKLSSLIAARTFSAVSSDTGKLLFRTRLTVAIDTPACFDTSLMVIRLIGEDLAIYSPIHQECKRFRKRLHKL